MHVIVITTLIGYVHPAKLRLFLFDFHGHIEADQATVKLGRYSYARQEIAFKLAWTQISRLSHLIQRLKMPLAVLKNLIDGLCPIFACLAFLIK